jgi:hypothetical protein
MAVLESPHWETITPTMQELLAWIGRQACATRFYLAGGTALALRMGHRRSLDFSLTLPIGIPSLRCWQNYLGIM